MLLCATVFILTANATYAQKDKNNKSSTTDTKTNGKTDPKSGAPKANSKPDPKAAKTDPKNNKADSKATDKANADARLASINGLSRDEKNTMTKCPLHGSCH